MEKELKKLRDFLEKNNIKIEPVIQVKSKYQWQSKFGIKLLKLLRVDLKPDARIISTKK